MADDAHRNVGTRITSDPERTEIDKPYASKDQAVDMPFRLLYVGNLCPERSAPDWKDGSEVLSVDSQGFAKCMQEIAPRLNIDIPNRLGEQPRILEIELAFSSLDAFEPVAIARQIDILAPLLDVRDNLEGVVQGRASVEELGKQLRDQFGDTLWGQALIEALESDAEAKAEEAADKTSTLDRLLGMVDMGENGKNTARPKGEAEELADRITDALLGPSQQPKRERPGTPVKQALADLDLILGRQLNEILNHPSVRDLESSWRGLKMLVDRLNFRENVYLEVLPATKSQLNEALHYQVVLPEHERGGSGPPLSAIVVDMSFGNGKQEVEQLEDLAKSGASLQTPIVTDAAPSFFGVQNHERVAGIPPLNQLFEQPEYIAWQKLREEQEASQLALTVPSLLLRYPYGDENPVDGINFNEAGALWGRGCLAVAAAMAQSYVETGWPTHIHKRRLENFPVVPRPQGHAPLGAVIPSSRQSEFGKAGFTVLGARTNRDTIDVARAQTVARPESHDDLVSQTEAKIHVTLPCQLFVSRMAHFLLMIQEELEPVERAEELVAPVSERVRAFLKGKMGDPVPRDAVSVEPVKHAEIPDQYLYAVRLKTPKNVLPREVSLVLGLRAPKVTTENGETDSDG